MGTAVIEADGLDDAVAAERAALTRATTGVEARALRGQAAELEHALGHPARARRLMAAVPTRQLDFLAAELRDELGDHPRALATIRRRTFHYAEGWGEADYLREEGRLAALTGDRDGAIAAYRRYLALRTDPDPSLRPEVERVRRALAALVAE